MFLQCFLGFLLFGCSYAQEYADDQVTGEQQLAHNYARQSYNPDLYATARSEPYDFGFQSTDEFGTIMNRQESSDNNGAVRGSYGYTDPYGVFRHVDYVADEFGFRAEVKSNEPGMGTQSPASVQIYAEPPPAGVIVERPYYHPYNHNHGQGNHVGQASGQQPARRTPGNASSNRQVRAGANAVRAASSAGGSRLSVYPFVQPQHQNAFNSNAVSSNQYPSTVSNQYAANAAAAAASSASGTDGSQYSGASGSGSQYSGSQYAASTAYQTSSNSAYPIRSPYGSQGYASLTSAGARSSAGASSHHQPIVPKPYDGPTYKIGNPHVTEFTSADKKQSGSILLPTLVTTGGAQTTLVKHIHTYPAA